MEQFIGRTVIMLLIIVPIDRECTHASTMRAERARGRRFLNAHSANFVSSKWNIFGIYGWFMGECKWF